MVFYTAALPLWRRRLFVLGVVMVLNLPIVEQLQGCKNVLIAGMGGGFDVFCGVPLYIDLQDRGFNVHLANFSFSDIANLRGGQRLSETLLGVTYNEPDLRAPSTWADPALGGLFAQWGAFVYFPELFLSQWFKQERGVAVPIWCFAKTGVQPLLANYRRRHRSAPRHRCRCADRWRRR